MIILNIIFYAFFIFIAGIIGYQLLLGILAMNAGQHQSFETKKFRKFAFVIPAHNEEKMVAKTIYSLNGLIYPKKMYDVFVIADNCEDETAKIASKLGAGVFERTDAENRGKGYALSWGFDKILQQESDYDAVIVIDSDSLISGNYLSVMNYYLEQGSRVIQSSDLVLPQPDNWSVEVTRIGFILVNYVKPLGRKILNLNMGLRGNGMCFDVSVLEKVPWKAWSLTEDAEYGLTLILSGEKIDFAPEATVWAQMPLKASNAVSQRSRWEFGRYQIAKKYTLEFLFLSLKKRSLKLFDVFIDLVTPPFVNTMILVSVLTLASFTLWLLDLTSLTYFIMWGSVLGAGILHLITGLYTAKADRNLYKSILYIPKYIFWKIKMYVKSMFNGWDVNWIRTTRDI